MFDGGIEIERFQLLVPADDLVHIAAPHTVEILDEWPDGDL